MSKRFLNPENFNRTFRQQKLGILDLIENRNLGVDLSLFVKSSGR